MRAVRGGPTRAGIIRQTAGRVLFAAIATLCLGLCGCTALREWLANGFKVGPNYARPPAPVAAGWIDGTDPRVSSAPARDCAWWTVLGDPMVNSLVQYAFQQNLSLKEAGFRVLAERAQLCIAVGNIFPQTQQAFAGYTRKGLSRTVANSQFTPQRWFNLYDLGFNLSWELDIWGRLRRGVEAADAELNASVEDYDAVLVTLIADLAQAYTDIRTLQTQIDYTKQNVELQRQTADMVKERFEGGAVSKLDLTQALQNLYDTEAQLPPLYISLRQANDRLCILLGMPMMDLTQRLGSAPIPTVPNGVAVGIPADLVRRRPDVRAAERQLAAQSARIGIADAQLYPALAINGTIGYETSKLRLLFNDKSIFGNWGPSFNWNILNYGRLINEVRIQDARFQALAMNYFDKALKADEEVENALALFLQSQQLVDDLQKAVAEARESVALGLEQYRQGKTDYIRVFITERELVRQLNLLARARGDVVQGLIAIYRALGGGWQIRCGPPPMTAAASPAPSELPMPRKLPETTSSTNEKVSATSDNLHSYITSAAEPVLRDR